MCRTSGTPLKEASSPEVVKVRIMLCPELTSLRKSGDRTIITWVDGGVVDRHCQVERHEYKMTEGRRTGKRGKHQQSIKQSTIC